MWVLFYFFFFFLFFLFVCVCVFHCGLQLETFQNTRNAKEKKNTWTPGFTFARQRQRQWLITFCPHDLPINGPRVLVWQILARNFLTQLQGWNWFRQRVLLVFSAQRFPSKSKLRMIFVSQQNPKHFRTWKAEIDQSSFRFKWHMWLHKISEMRGKDVTSSDPNRLAFSSPPRHDLRSFGVRGASKWPMLKTWSQKFSNFFHLNHLRCT